MISKPNQKSTLWYSLTGIILGIVIFTLFIGIYVFYQAKKYKNNIYPNVYLDNIDLGGKTKKQAKDLFSKKKLSFDKVKVEVIYRDEFVATLSAKTLALHTDTDEVIDRAYLIGRTNHLPTLIRQQTVVFFNLEKFHFLTHVIYTQAAINDFILAQQDRFNYPAKNALFEFTEGKVVSFKPDEKGLEIQSEKFKEDLEAALQKLNKRIVNQTVILTDKIILPEITLGHANQFGIEELVGEGVSNYSHSIPTRIHNVILAASKFHGVLIPKGAMFSFNNTVGDISSLTGYEPAYIIKNGRTVLGDGGGVCQVSTTLFRAAINTGLPIAERHAHAYRVSYYENGSQPGFDATIFSPSVDLKFQNNTPASILIQTAIDKESNILTFKFYGKRDDRQVNISPVTIWDESPPPAPLYQDDPTLPKGEVKQVDFPAWGAKTKFTYKVIKGNETSIDETFFSNFRPWQAVFLVGQG